MNTTKFDLCVGASKRINLSQDSVRKAFDAIIDEIIDTMAKGYKIELRGFGVFKVKNRKPVLGRNPKTGDIVKIPERNTPTFKFSKEALRIFKEKTYSK